MNENDRTTLEQAIYEEMELTPEMIRSIRTLCGVCLCSFVEFSGFHPSSALRRLTHRLRWLTASRPSIPTHPSNRPLRTLGALRT